VPSSQRDERIDMYNALKVKMISPTMRGIQASSQILRSASNESDYGILSFPTETTYSLVSFVPFKRSRKYIPEHKTSSHWETILHLKSPRYTHKNEPNSDRPLVFLHRPAQAYNVVSFSKPKTFVYKEQLSIENDNKDNQIPSNIKYTAVTFSESHEVMNRLVSSFWPGPVTIFAPVRTLNSSEAVTKSGDKSIIQCTNHGIEHCTTSSCSSLISLTSEQGDDVPNYSSSQGSSTIEDESEEAVPILPTSALTTLNSLLLDEKISDETRYVGIRCPSHPLARSILAEVYGKTVIKKDSPDQRRRRKVPGVVVGFNASIPSTGSLAYPLSCKDVCRSLLCYQDDLNSELRNSDSIKPSVHVLNGEDRREMFYVPACQYGRSSLISLVIDEPNRIVFLLRDKSLLKSNTDVSLDSKQGNDIFDVRVDDVIHSLRRCKQEKEAGSVKSKAIASVMHKWKVLEKTV